MRRRDFLKGLAASPLAGVVKTDPPPRKAVPETQVSHKNRYVAIALEEIPEGEYGWFWVGGVRPDK